MLDQLGDPMGKGLGLARSGAGNDQERSGRRLTAGFDPIVSGPALLRIEMCKTIQLRHRWTGIRCWKLNLIMIRFVGPSMHSLAWSVRRIALEPGAFGTLARRGSLPTIRIPSRPFLLCACSAVIMVGRPTTSRRIKFLSL